MNIGPYSFEEFKARAKEFHGYPAPGLILGGYMVAMAQKALPEGTLFEALVETKKCLPDAVQLLTLCSAGNNWMKVINLGRYAVSLYDKYSGVGYRVHLDMEAIEKFSEIRSWLLKDKPKREQDTDKLFRQLEEAGDSILRMNPVKVDESLLGHSHMGPVAACPECGEAYPVADGDICLGCLGNAPFALLSPDGRPSEPVEKKASIRVSRLDHLVLTVRSLDKTLDFYRTIGMREIRFGEGRTALAFGKQKINLQEEDSPRTPSAAEARAGSADLCFVVKTPLPDVMALLKEAGIALLLGPVERTGATGKIVSIYLRDPDGNLVELSNTVP
ncbi:FmdE family protein [Desulfovibrio sp. OttesenSCG-928-A18]|nr:FmdE family protein [Desulfovibrio sp. OttesenSCG-928-A18]